VIERLTCALASRALARQAALGRPPGCRSWLGAHLAACDRCRQTWVEFGRLTDGLTELIAAPRPPDRFTAAVVERMVRPQHRPGLVAPVLSAAVAVTLLVVAYQRLRPAAPSAASSHRLVAAELRSPTVIDPEDRSNPIASVVVKPPPKRRAPLVNNRAAGRHRPWRPARRNWTRRPAGIVRPRSRPGSRGAPRPPTPEQWTLYAALADSAGRPRDAAGAYGRAFAATGDPGLGLAAGQAAESAGDMGDAVDYYARLLARNPVQSEWRSEDD
jgi:hypothetical protein